MGWLRVVVQIAKATLPEDLDGHEVLILLPELASVAQVDKVVHVWQSLFLSISWGPKTWLTEP
jgi:hypothetical protein